MRRVASILGAGLIGVLAVAATDPAAAPTADWQPVGDDLQMDVRSVRADATGFTVWLKEPDARREGLPPPAALSLIKARIDCRANTSQFLALDLLDARGRSIDGIRPNLTQPIAIKPGSMPDRIGKRVCPTIVAR